MRQKEQFFLDFGPMQIMMTAVFTKSGGQKILLDAAEYAKENLRQLAARKKIAACSQDRLIDINREPIVLQKMVAAVIESGDTTLTPMAAVAGAIADSVADFLQQAGALKVMVNNGGDIAVRLQSGEKIRVALQTKAADTILPQFEIFAKDGIGGIACSGLGGRSLSKGIASAAMVTASSAALADACATSLGNAVYTDHPNIRLALAEDLDPLTDIRGHYVVKETGLLPSETITRALENGGKRAKEMMLKGVVSKAAAFIGRQGIFLPEKGFIVG